MSEEITYANLKFPESKTAENVQELDGFGTKAPPASSQIWRHMALTLTLLCLLLLIGLGILGGMFYNTLKIESGKLNRLQSVKEELERNISLQLMTNINKSENIRNLSVALQNLASKLCRELNRNEPGHRCKPCPNSWMWYKNKCYFLSETYETWQMSEMLCSAQNASLLQIQEENTLDFVKFKNLYAYWVGVSSSQYEKDRVEVDEIIMPSARLNKNKNDIDKMYCGYIHGKIIYYTYCTQKYHPACEKKANPVEAESMLSEGPDGRI